VKPTFANDLSIVDPQISFRQIDGLFSDEDALNKQAEIYLLLDNIFYAVPPDQRLYQSPPEAPSFILHDAVKCFQKRRWGPIGINETLICGIRETLPPVSVGSVAA
jgi:hypothetical protein